MNTTVNLDALEKILLRLAINRETMTYRELALQLKLKPPNTINQTVQALEILMATHAAKNIPQFSCLIISKMRQGIPAPGFFIRLKQLGIYSGEETGFEAENFHNSEKIKCYEYANNYYRY